MSFSRCSAALLWVASLLLLVVPLNAEYDILTRYNFTRPEGERRFWLYSPTRYQLGNATEQRPLPLILFFHGYSDLCELQGYPSQFSIWAYVAEVHQYHIAVMCGTNPGPGWKSGYMNSTEGQVDDLAYTRTSLSMIKAAVHVKEGHVFAMGHSNGAMMSETLACKASDIINAIASNAGETMVGPSINESFAMCDKEYAGNHTSILKIHGTHDQAVIYNGTNYLPSAMADTDSWGKRNGCKGEQKQLWQHGIATATGWYQCAGGTDVELVSVAGVNHQVRLRSQNSHARISIAPPHAAVSHVALVRVCCCLVDHHVRLPLLRLRVRVLQPRGRPAAGCQEPAQQAQAGARVTAHCRSGGSASERWRGWGESLLWWRVRLLGCAGVR